MEIELRQEKDYVVFIMGLGEKKMQARPKFQQLSISVEVVK